MNGTFCPGRVTLTCRGIEIPSLTWTINGSDLASYSNYDPMQPLPLTLSLANPTSGVQVQVESVNPYPNNPFFYNITSTLSGDVSVLRGSTIDCRRLPLRSNTIVIRGRYSYVCSCCYILSVRVRVRGLKCLMRARALNLDTPEHEGYSFVSA